MRGQTFLSCALAVLASTAFAAPLDHQNEKRGLSYAGNYDSVDIARSLYHRRRGEGGGDAENPGDAAAAVSSLTKSVSGATIEASATKTSSRLLGTAPIGTGVKSSKQPKATKAGGVAAAGAAGEGPKATASKPEGSAGAKATESTGAGVGSSKATSSKAAGAAGAKSTASEPTGAVGAGALATASQGAGGAKATPSKTKAAKPAKSTASGTEATAPTSGGAGAGGAKATKSKAASAGGAKATPSVPAGGAGALKGTATGAAGAKETGAKISAAGGTAAAAKAKPTKSSSAKVAAPAKATPSDLGANINSSPTGAPKAGQAAASASGGLDTLLAGLSGDGGTAGAGGNLLTGLEAISADVL